jgi:hypothetical protein
MRGLGHPLVQANHVHNLDRPDDGHYLNSLSTAGPAQIPLSLLIF